MTTELGMKVHMKGSFDTVVASVVEALKVEGFGVLTEIDVQRTLREKLQVEMRPYRILGACNPQLAHRALTAVRDVGLFLPCNVTVAEEEDGSVNVGIVDPIVMLNVTGESRLQPVAAEAHARLERVAAQLRG